VGDHIGAHPEDEKVLASGQVAVRAIDALRTWSEPPT
jgi:hypothetical protein